MTLPPKWQLQLEEIIAYSERTGDYTALLRLAHFVDRALLASGLPSFSPEEWAFIYRHVPPSPTVH